MADEFDALATAAAQQLVEAMARDSWELVKHQFARVTQGRERRVDASRIALAQDSGIGREQVRSAEISAWRTRLRDSLDENPQLAGALRQIVAMSPADPAASVAQSAGPSQSVQQAAAPGGSDVTQVFAPDAGNVRVDSPEHRHFRLIAPFAVVAQWTRVAVAAHPLVSATLALVIIAGGAAGTVLGGRHGTPADGHGRAAGRGVAAHARKSAPSGGMVSITLSPARPAGANALALSVRLIRQRAGLIGLRSVEVDVAGPGVVVTGPLADEAPGSCSWASLLVPVIRRVPRSSPARRTGQSNTCWTWRRYRAGTSPAPPLFALRSPTGLST